MSPRVHENKYLNNTISAGTEDKRLEIDLEAMRQMIWERSDGTQKDSLTEDQQDKVAWIDTSTMIADPLTKKMDCDRLLEAMKTNYLDLTPTAKSQMAKLMKQSQRRKQESAEDLAED